MNNNDELEYEIGLLSASTEKLFRDIDELDATEDYGLTNQTEPLEVFGASVEELTSDKFIRNLQRGRENWYGDFISNRTRLYHANTMWLQAIEKDQTKLSASLAKAKSMDSKVLGKLISDKMDGRFIAAMSLMNGSDLKQIKHAKRRYSKLKDEIKKGRDFIRGMSKFADKEFGFNDLLDDKLEPVDVIEFIRDYYSDSPDVTASISSIRIYGVKRRFKTDKRQIMLETINEPSAKTVLLSWSGSAVTFMTLMDKGETRIWNKSLVHPDAHYDDFYKRYSHVVEKHISDTTAIANLIDEMNESMIIFNKINDSLSKLYMPSKKTFDELKFIRRFHMNITKILAFRIDDLMTSYRISHSIAKIMHSAAR